MAQEIGFKIKIDDNTSVVIKSMEDLDRVMKEDIKTVGQLKVSLKDAIKSIDFNGPVEQVELAQNAVRKMKDQFEDFRSSLKKVEIEEKVHLIATGFQGLAGAFGGVTAAASLFGKENEDLTKTMVKLQQAMTLVQSAQSIAALFTDKNIIGWKSWIAQMKASDGVIGKINSGLKNFGKESEVIGTGVESIGKKGVGALTSIRTALAATGIALIPIALGLVVANFDKIKKAIESIFGPLKGLTDGIRDIASVLTLGLIDNVKISQAKLVEEIESKNIELYEKTKDVYQKIAKMYGATNDDILKSESDMIEKQIYNIQRVLGSSKLSTEEKIKYNDKLIDAEKKLIELADQRGQNQLGVLKTDIEIDKTKLENAKGYYSDLNKLDLDYKNKLLEIQFDQSLDAEGQQKKILQLDLETGNSRTKIQEEFNKKVIDLNDIELERLRKNQELLLKDKQDINSKITLLEIQMGRDIQNINKQYDDKKKAEPALAGKYEEARIKAATDLEKKFTSDRLKLETELQKKIQQIEQETDDIRNQMNENELDKLKTFEAEKAKILLKGAEERDKLGQQLAKYLESNPNTTDEVTKKYNAAILKSEQDQADAIKNIDQSKTDFHAEQTQKRYDFEIDVNNRILNDDKSKLSERLQANQNIYNLEVKSINKKFDEELKASQNYTKEEIAEIEKRRQAALGTAGKNKTETDVQLKATQVKKTFDNVNQYVQLGLNAIEEIGNTIFNNMLTNLDKQMLALQNRLDALDKQYQTIATSEQSHEQKLATARGANAKQLQKQIANEMQLRKQVELQQLAAQQQLVADQIEKKKLMREQAEYQKALNIVQAVIGTAEGIVQGLASPFPLNIALPIAAGITGAIQIGVIAAQPIPSMAVGGYTGSGFGKPDSSGFKRAGVVHEGEYVVKKSIVDSNPDIVGHLEGIRLKGYATGGVATTATNNIMATAGTGSLTHKIDSLSNNMEAITKRPVIVSLKHFAEEYGRYQTVRNIASTGGNGTSNKFPVTK